MTNAELENIKNRWIINRAIMLKPRRHVMAFRDKVDTGSGETFKFDKIGTKLTGVYLGGVDFPEGKFGPSVRHMFKTEDGIKVAYAKPNSQLGRMLAGEEGNRLAVTFTETKPSGKGNPTKIYKVQVDDSFTRLAPEYLVNTAAASDNDSEYSDAATTEDDDGGAQAAIAAEKRAKVLASLGKSKR